MTNIIKRKNGNYQVKINKRAATLKDARAKQKFIKQYTNCVGVYQDPHTKKFIVQTYKEFKKPEDAIELRDLLSEKLKEYDGKPTQLSFFDDKN